MHAGRQKPGAAMLQEGVGWGVGFTAFLSGGAVYTPRCTAPSGSTPFRCMFSISLGCLGISADMPG